MQQSDDKVQKELKSGRDTGRRGPQSRTVEANENSSIVPIGQDLHLLLKSLHLNAFTSLNRCECLWSPAESWMLPIQRLDLFLIEPERRMKVSRRFQNKADRNMDVSRVR